MEGDLFTSGSKLNEPWDGRFGPHLFAFSHAPFSNPSGLGRWPTKLGQASAYRAPLLKPSAVDRCDTI